MLPIIRKAVYVKALHLNMVKCFRGEFVLGFTGKKVKPANWTVIIGNNNTGKTTILKALAALEPEDYEIVNPSPSKEYTFEPVGTSNIGALFENQIYYPYITQEYINSDIEKISAEFLFQDEAGLSDLDLSEGYYIASGRWKPTKNREILNFKIYGYGTSRRSTRLTGITGNIPETAFENFVNDKTDLINAEEWILQTDYAVKNGSKAAQKQLEKIRDIFLRGHILPDIADIRFTTTEKLNSFVEVKTLQGWVKLSSLGYGYQVTIAWLADLAKRMFDRYPELENPLHGPAIVLVDEIDLHLHPEWQRKIIKYLSDLFPNTQFIVTAHSPLIVQSAENVNLIMLEKDEQKGSINVRQQFGSFQGWTVEEILRELMDMGEKTRSDRFLKLLEAFEKGLDEDNYEEAKAAYDELDKILHPASSQRKLLSIQLSSLVPA